MSSNAEPILSVNQEIGFTQTYASSFTARAAPSKRKVPTTPQSSDDPAIEPRVFGRVTGGMIGAIWGKSSKGGAIGTGIGIGAGLIGGGIWAHGIRHFH